MRCFHQFLSLVVLLTFIQLSKEVDGAMHPDCHQATQSNKYTECAMCSTSSACFDLINYPSGSCTECNAGSFRCTTTMRYKGCQVCPTGRFYESQGTQSSCKSCPSGKYQSSKGKTLCYTCGSGLVPNDDRTGCVPA